jgi:hypothetical protein
VLACPPVFVLFASVMQEQKENLTKTGSDGMPFGRQPKKLQMKYYG